MVNKRKRSDAAQNAKAVASQKKKMNGNAKVAAVVKGKKTEAKFNKPNQSASKTKNNSTNTTSAASATTTTKTKTITTSSTEKNHLENSWSKSKKKRMRSLKSKQKKSSAEDANHDSKPQNSGAKKGRAAYADDQQKSGKKMKKGDDATASQSDKSHQNDKSKIAEQATATATASSKKPLNSKMHEFMERLKGSRFRELNEELYTTTSTSSLERFSKNPALYDQYHDGFRHQVEQWPSNPVDVIVQWITRQYPSSRKQKQQQQQQHPIVVADFGCGDAALAKAILQVRDPKGSKCCPFQVHSFDLVASCDLVTACDMAHTPLETESVDVGIFCLSLMGTNLADFIREAHRVLKPHGRVKVAEVRSRFANHPKKEDDDDLPEFIKVLDQLGFSCRHTDRTNTMFVLLELEKNGKTPNPDVTYTAKPCLYKRR